MMPVDIANGFPQCAKSGYALILIPGDTLMFYEPVVEARVSSRDISLTLTPEDERDAAFLSNISHDSRAIVAYHYHSYLCRLTNREMLSKPNVTRFDLKFVIDESDFSPSMEMGFSSVSADKFAELRTRRLLLNENPASETNDVNAITRELFLSGMDTYVRVERSPFPQTFATFRNDPARFLEIAWILAVMQLQMSACVSEIQKLILTLRGIHLDIEFLGRRKKQFVNAPPPEIRVTGTCLLANEG